MRPINSPIPTLPFTPAAPQRSPQTPAALPPAEPLPPGPAYRDPHDPQLSPKPQSPGKKQEHTSPPAPVSVVEQHSAVHPISTAPPALPFKPKPKPQPASALVLPIDVCLVHSCGCVAYNVFRNGLDHSKPCEAIGTCRLVPVRPGRNVNPKVGNKQREKAVCECPRNFAGTRCERCAFGFVNYPRCVSITRPTATLKPASPVTLPPAVPDHLPPHTAPTTTTTTTSTGTGGKKSGAAIDEPHVGEGTFTPKPVLSKTSLFVTYAAAIGASLIIVGVIFLHLTGSRGAAAVDRAGIPLRNRALNSSRRRPNHPDDNL